jgi:hypothetical protein
MKVAILDEDVCTPGLQAYSTPLPQLSDVSYPWFLEAARHGTAVKALRMSLGDHILKEITCLTSKIKHTLG